MLRPFKGLRGLRNVGSFLLVPPYHKPTSDQVQVSGAIFSEHSSGAPHGSPRK